MKHEHGARAEELLPRNTKTKKHGAAQDHGSEEAGPEVSQYPESGQWTLRADPHTLPG